ncbi:hypothetical protein CP533_6759 [Ophiocordyceps camponoti-saundersi (nom. inval.)]|nr:hypothetical protein CP533_6759 [Ophiocordyceps camponoti-saundersi (nom. inval.)]
MSPDTVNLLSRMTSSLPELDTTDTNPKVILHNAPDAVALLVNALLQAQGFTLTRVGDQDASSSSSPPSSSTSTEQTSGRLPAGWSASQPFSYTHSSSSPDLSVTVRVDRLGPRLDIRVLAEGASSSSKNQSILRLEWDMGELVREDGLPVRVDHQQHVSSKLQRAFVSDEAVARPSLHLTIHVRRFQRAFESTIINELLPESHRPSSSSTLRESHQPSPLLQRQSQPNKGDDDVVFPAPPATSYPPPPTSTATDEFQPPGFDDELDLARHRNVVLPDGRSPFSIGHDDLYPAGLGPRDPLRPSFGPPSGGGGMHPTFDDPLFGPNPGPEGFDPQIPPGARWDPVGPGAGPGPGFPSRGGRHPFGPGGSFGPGGGGGGGGII